MITVVVCSHKCKVNPDNIATPIAASLGDLTTLAILASIGGFLFRIIGKHTLEHLHSMFVIVCRYLHMATDSHHSDLPRSHSHLDRHLLAECVRARRSHSRLVGTNTVGQLFSYIPLSHRIGHPWLPQCLFQGKDHSVSS